jgi:hypothetical protein
MISFPFVPLLHSRSRRCVVIGDRSVHNTEVGFAHTPRVHADRVHRTFFTAAFSFHRGRFSDLIIRSREGVRPPNSGPGMRVGTCRRLMVGHACANERCFVCMT